MTRPVVPPQITDVVAPLGPNAMAMLDGAPSRRCGPRCGEQNGRHWCPPSAIGQCAVFKDMYAPSEDDLREFAKQPSPRPTVVQPTKHHKRIVAVIKAAVEHRRQPCYGVKMTDAQVDELSRGIAQNLICNFKIEEAP